MCLDAKMNIHPVCCFKKLYSDCIPNWPRHQGELGQLGTFSQICNFLLIKAINIHNAFILKRCWHQRHGVISPGMAEVSSLGPLVLIAVI